MMGRAAAVLLAVIGIVGSIAHADFARAEDSGPPVVVELFTSQGCSSCPPADALLGELSKRSDVLALGFHVDYWDYIGWKDPYASKLATKRQRQYAESFKLSFVYTPQMIINGDAESVGSDRAGVEAAVEKAKTRPAVHPTLVLARLLRPATLDARAARRERRQHAHELSHCPALRIARHLEGGDARPDHRAGPGRGVRRAARSGHRGAGTERRRRPHPRGRAPGHGAPLNASLSLS